jgi:predicted nucleotidyltransferase
MHAISMFTAPQSRVLEWLFGQPTRAFHINELLRLTGLGSASLQREVARLLAGGLVIDERIANIRRVKANPSSPVFHELVSIVQKTLGLVPALTLALQPHAANIEFAALFGSTAAGHDTAQSDIDILVVSDNVSFFELTIALEPVEQKLSRKVQIQLYTFVNRVLARDMVPIIGTLD